MVARKKRVRWGRARILSLSLGHSASYIAISRALLSSIVCTVHRPTQGGGPPPPTPPARPLLPAELMVERDTIVGRHQPDQTNNKSAQHTTKNLSSCIQYLSIYLLSVCALYARILSIFARWICWPRLKSLRSRKQVPRIQLSLSVWAQLWSKQTKQGGGLWV